MLYLLPCYCDRGYKPEYWYWEAVILIRKLSMAATSVFLSTLSPYMQGLSAMMILGISLVVQLIFRPYEDDELNTLEASGLGAGVASIFFCLWTYETEYRHMTFIVTLATVLIFAVNGVWLAVALHAMSKKAEHVLDRLQRLLQKCSGFGVPGAAEEVGAAGDVELTEPGSDRSSTGGEGKGDNSSSHSMFNPLSAPLSPRNAKKGSGARKKRQEGKKKGTSSSRSRSRASFGTPAPAPDDSVLPPSPGHTGLGGSSRRPSPATAPRPHTTRGSGRKKGVTAKRGKGDTAGRRKLSGSAAAGSVWQRGFDEGSGRHYYGNTVTGETSWTVPSEWLYPAGAHPPPPPEHNEDEEWAPPPPPSATDPSVLL